MNSWPPPGGAGWYADGDDFSVDPATSHIKKVETKGEFIWVTVEKPEKTLVKIIINLKQIIPPEKDVFEKVAKALNSAIGKTLIESREISI